MIVCQVCGTQNPDGARFCDGCGVELAAKPLPTIPEARETDLPENSTFEQTVVPPTPPIPEPQTEVPAQDAGSSSAAPLVEEPLEDVSSVSLEKPAETPLQDSASGPITPESTPAAPLESAPVESAPVNSAPVESTPAPETPSAPVAESQPATPTSIPVPAPEEVHAAGPKAARLAIKKYGVLSGDAIPLGAGTLTLGRFDASTGPVDIDVTGLPGSEHVSRRHAQLQFENGQWLVKDLGSTNGVFVRRAGEVNFGPRIAEPTPLHTGDEIAFGNLLMIYQED